MFERIGRFAVLRPWTTIATWLLATVALAMLAPQLEPVSDQAEFLPSHYESVKVAAVEKQAFAEESRPAAIAVFLREDGKKLTGDDLAEVARVCAALTADPPARIEEVTTDTTALSPDGTVALGSVVATTEDLYDQKLLEAVKDLRAEGHSALEGTGLAMGLTGSAATALDTQESTGETDAMIMMATLVLIVALLLLIFRSPLIAILPVLIIAVAYVVATGLISFASDLGGLQADSSISAILIVVLFGVGTDYILFLLFRYREELRSGTPAKDAMIHAVGRVGETIASAAGVVIVAFLALLLSSMGMLRAMGPSLAISVAVALLAGLTLVPAVFSLLGTKVFWPSRSWQRPARNRIAGRTGRLIARRPVVVAVFSACLLGALALGVSGFKAEFDGNTSLPGDLESVRAMEDLQKGFPAGQADPSLVYLRSDDRSPIAKDALTAFGKELAAVDGVDQVSPPVPGGKGEVARFSVVLAHAPSSERGIALAGGPLRTGAHAAAPDGTTALVGGTGALLSDVKDAVDRDYRIVFPAAGLAVMLILGLLLRSVVAPFYLLIAVGLGFGATLGATVWVFQDLRGEQGLLFSLPIVVYLFVVAIGTDYNILMVARLREEMRAGHAPREALARAVGHSAPTVCSAAVILAGTFGVLLFAQNSMLQQMGFAVAFGILLTALVMAVLLVPAVTSVLGAKAWWPGNRVTTAARDGEAGQDSGPGSGSVGDRERMEV